MIGCLKKVATFSVWNRGTTDCVIKTKHTKIKTMLYRNPVYFDGLISGSGPYQTTSNNNNLFSYMKNFISIFLPIIIDQNKKYIYVEKHYSYSYVVLSPLEDIV